MSEDPDTERFRADVVAGLTRTQPEIPCKYLYDARGSELFEAICETAEYYVTRADLALHDAHLAEIAERIGPEAHIIELGSGAGIKTRRLLDELQRPRAYTPIEISSAALDEACRKLEHDFPELDIHPVQADYTRPIEERFLKLTPPPQRRVIYFPGSTISNFDRDEAIEFLRRLRLIAGDGGAILIGVDLIKSEERLIAAYDDRGGVTAAFDRNLLTRMQRELDADVDPEAFEHEARFNRELDRIEMHLVARRPTGIIIDGHRFEFERGDSIHTESSHKYSVESFRALASQAGLQSEQVWFDPDGLFSMHWLVPD
jgi:dimethylhistidine N-methyltransferase